MAIIVEDGTGVTGANSYVNQADLDAYWSVRGDTSWATLPAGTADLLIIQAMDLFQAHYAARLRGTRTKVDQPLAYPRTGVYDIEGQLRPATAIPAEIKKAMCLLVAKARDTGSVIPDTAATSGVVKSLRQKVGELETETEYFEGTSATTSSLGTVYNEVEAVLKPLLGGGGLNGRVVLG